jgi:hypothetical protein
VPPVVDVVLVFVPVVDPVPPPRPVWPPPVFVVVSVLGVELELPVEFELEFEPVEFCVVDVCFVLVVAAGGVAAPVVGTVSGGAPVVLDPDPPPQAEMASAAASAAPAASFLVFLKGIHPAPAPRAVEQILLRELIAVRAETQVLDRPGQLGRGWRERK